MKVYIVSPKYEYEGLSDPIAVFEKISKAEKFVQTLSSWKACRPIIPQHLMELFYEDDPEAWDKFFDKEDKWRKEQPNLIPSHADDFVITEMELQ